MKQKTKTEAETLAELKRTNIFLTKGSLRNLEICALIENRSVAAIIRDVIDRYLAEKGFDPTKTPKVTFSYP